MLALLGQKRSQDRRLDMDEVAERVDVEAVPDRGDFDARDELDSGGGACSGRDAARRDGVVVGDAQHVDARRFRTRDEIGRRQSAVGRGRVCVEIDQCADFARDAVFRGGRGRWRSLMARYWRINRSRCARSSSANSRKICLPSESSNRSP